MENENIIYSNFNRDLIGYAIAELITAISGDDFLYGKTISFYEDKIDSAIGYKYVEVADTLYIVVRRPKYREFYRSDGANYVDSLVNDGDAIYFYNLKDMDIKMDYSKFSYVKSFIDELIQYCCEKDIKDITKEEINGCMKRFLINYKTKTEKGHTLSKSE